MAQAGVGGISDLICREQGGALGKCRGARRVGSRAACDGGSSTAFDVAKAQIAFSRSVALKKLCHRGCLRGPGVTELLRTERRRLEADLLGI